MPFWAIRKGSYLTNISGPDAPLSTPISETPPVDATAPIGVSTPIDPAAPLPLRIDGAAREPTGPALLGPIDYPAAMLDQIRLAVVDAFFAIPRGGLEIGGVLFGEHRQHRVVIEGYRLLTCDHAAGPSFTLSEQDELRLHELLGNAVAEGLQPVGWFRSRTRSEISLSPSDVALFDKYFPESWQVALVLRPQVARPTRAGFFFREEVTLGTGLSYVELILEPLAAGAPQRPAGPVLSIPETAPTYPELQFLAAASAPQSYQRTFWIVALCLVLAAAGLATHEFLGSKEPESFSFQARDRNGQLQLAWDHDAKSIREARAGKLEITDGPARVTVALGAGQLRRGSFYYARQTERVDVHLTLIDPDGRSSDEYLSFLGRAPVVESEP